MFIIHLRNPGYVSTGTIWIICSPDNECRKFSKNSPIWVRTIVAPGHCISELQTRGVTQIDNSYPLRYPYLP